MLKLEMKFNEGLMLEDGKYEPAAVYGALDRTFSKYGMRRQALSDGTVCYLGSGRAGDYGVFGRLITSLKDKPWFMPYLVKWLWYNSDDGDSDGDFSVEDVLYHYSKRESVA